MRVAFDTNMLSHLLSKGAFGPTVMSDGKRVPKISDFPERMNFLLETLESPDVEPIVIPTQVLAEFLAKGQDAAESYLPALMNPTAFDILHYGVKEAIETAHIDLEVIRRTKVQGNKDKRDGDSGRSWQLIKIDRQIISTVKLAKVDAFYCDDADLAKIARRNGINVIMADELPLSPDILMPMFPLPDVVGEEE